METLAKPINIDVVDGVPVVSSVLISEHAERRHKDIIGIIKAHKESLSEFGRVLFQTAPFETKGGMQNITFCELNEQQATFLMTLLSNKGNVVEFKKNLVKAFFLMKEKLSGQVANQDMHPFMLEIVKSNQTTTEAVVKMGESMQTLTKHFMEINNEMTRLKSHTRDTLEEMNHTMKNMSIGINSARGDAQQGMQVGEEVLKVVEKLEIYYRRDTLTSTQQQQINKRIDERARELASEHGIKSEVAKMSIYIKLKSYFDVPMYSAIKSESFAKALAVIDDHSLTYEECGE
jgi:phage regulator Rha-like protein